MTSVNYLRPAQIDELETERKNHTALIGRADPDGKLNKGESMQAIRRIDDTLRQAPPDLNADQRDKASKLILKLEAEIKDGMLSHEEMRRCPPGAVDQNRRWKRQKSQIIQDYKNALLALNKGIAAEEAADLCNLDRLRPRSSELNMHGAIIPEQRHMSFPSELFKSRWDEIFLKNDPEKESLEKQVADLQAQVAARSASVGGQQRHSNTRR